MKLIFIGPQGSGKGKQSKIISGILKIAHISTGDLLRNTTGDLKKEIDRVINQGLLMPDDLMLKILRERIKKEDCENGFILDGYPRNIGQAKDLVAITEINKVIEISISDKEAIKRVSSRLYCKDCGAVFNLKTDPPKEKNKCDSCRSNLSQRKDDTEDAIKKRLEIYHKETEPILKLYDSAKINGKQSIKKVTEDILKALEN